MSGTEFPDHFSGHADAYARYRPDYPGALYDWLAGECRLRNVAWDVACGSGQASAGLVRRFRVVVANDASVAQLSAMPRLRGVHPVAALAERAPIRAHRVDLVTCAQAAHWLNMDAFAAEVRRIARPGALVALWSYGLAEVTPELDHPVRHFHSVTLEPYWPPQRSHVEARYRDLPFPFAEVRAPDFAMEKRWTLSGYCRYLATWSAYRRCLASGAADPLPALRSRLAGPWGDGARTVRWPLHMRVGVVK